MKKILLIDDRTPRQNNFTKDTGIDLTKYNDIIDNFTADSYVQLLERFRKNDFDVLNDYETIITHRSAYSEINSQVLDKLKDICKKQNKNLVFFSGGISSVFYQKEPFEFLLVNSKVLYSENLKLFFEDNEPNILMIGYGKKWKLNILLNILEKINKFIELNDKKEIAYDKFITKTNVGLVKNLIDMKEPPTKNGFITNENLKKFSKDIVKKIKLQVVLDV